MMIRCRALPALIAALVAGPACAAHADDATSYSVASRWSIPGPGGWDYLTFDSTAQRLYVTRGDRVVVLDGVSGQARGEVTALNGVHGVALGDGGKRGFASNGRGDSVTVFDTASFATQATIAIEAHNPDAILYDAATKHLFTFNGKSHDATVIDVATNKPIATIPLSGKPEFAVSDGHGRVIVNIEDKSELAVIDAKSNKVTATWPLTDCEEPSGLALDHANGRLFSVCQNNALVVTDAKSGKHVATVAIGAGPDAAIYDATRHLVFSPNGEDGTLTVIHQDDADHYRVLSTVPTQKSARTMAYDEKSGRAFLAAAEFDAAPPSAEGQPKTRPPMKPDSFVVLVVSPKH